MADRDRVILMEMNVDIKQLLTFMFFLMECTRKLNVGMLIHHYLVKALVYSMMPYDLDRNFQGHCIGYNALSADRG